MQGAIFGEERDKDETILGVLFQNKYDLNDLIEENEDEGVKRKNKHYS